MFYFPWLEVKPFEVSFDQIGKQQVGEVGELPGFGFFLIKDEVNDLAQVGVGLFVMELELLFQVGEGD